MSMYDCAVCGEPRCEHVINELHETRAMLKEALEALLDFVEMTRLTPKAREFLNKPKIREMLE